MKRRRSIAHIEESENYHSKHHTLNDMGMNDVINGLVTWMRPIQVEGGLARFGWSRLDSPSGGLFYSQFHGTSQAAHTSVYYLEEEYTRAQQYGHMIRPHDTHALALREAVYKAKQAQYEALESARASRRDTAIPEWEKLFENRMDLRKRH